MLYTLRSKLYRNCSGEGAFTLFMICRCIVAHTCAARVIELVRTWPGAFMLPAYR
jgi:hypothetical protein